MKINLVAKISYIKATCNKCGVSQTIENNIYSQKGSYRVMHSTKENTVLNSCSKCGYNLWTMSLEIYLFTKSESFVDLGCVSYDY